MTTNAFCEAVREARSRRGMTQRALAEAVGAHVNTVARLERGELIPSSELAWRLAAALDLDLNAFKPQRTA